MRRVQGNHFFGVGAKSPVGFGAKSDGRTVTRLRQYGQTAMNGLMAGLTGALHLQSHFSKVGSGGGTRLGTEGLLTCAFVVAGFAGRQKR